VLNYLHGKEGSRIIGGNMAGNNPRVMTAEFAVSQQLNPRLEKAVYHASLSLAHEEHLDDKTWNDLVAEYLEGMEFTGSQYVVYRHSDKHHDHVHIVASRIRITDGTTVNDSWDYVRSEKLIRSLEQKYQLTPTISSKQKLQRGQSRGEKELVERTGEESIRGKLQKAIDEETENSLSMPELVSNLKNRGIDARISLTRTNKIRGISYQSDGIAISGTRLGKAYTFPGLQKYRGVSYDERLDRLALEKAIRDEVIQPSLVTTNDNLIPAKKSLRDLYQKYKQNARATEMAQIRDIAQLAFRDGMSVENTIKMLKDNNSAYQELVAKNHETTARAIVKQAAATILVQQTPQQPLLEREQEIKSNQSREISR
jgi:Relaxase/Mobilisation nuclease domain